MKELSKLTSKCKSSCQVVDIRIEENPQNYGVLSRNENFKVGLLRVSNMTPGYYINIPSTASLTSISYDYGFISYVAEFAGWSGMFVGASNPERLMTSILQPRVSKDPLVTAPASGR